MVVVYKMGIVHFSTCMLVICMYMQLASFEHKRRYHYCDSAVARIFV